MAHNFNFTEGGYIPDSYDFDFEGESDIYNVLAGISNNFIAIWADADASLSNGKFYVASLAAFSIVNDTALFDYYTETHAGATNETLEQDDIIDINI